MEDKKNRLVFYFVDIQNKENEKNINKEIKQKEKKINISIKENTGDGLNKFVHSIFYGGYEYKKSGKYYVIDNLQINLIINEVDWHKEFTEYIKKEKIELQSREVLLLYQVFATRILYMILMNHSDNLADYIKTNDLKLKFDILCDEFVKSISDFKTKENVLDFLFNKMLDTDQNKIDVDKMKKEISDCVKSLLENKNNDDAGSYTFGLYSGEKNKVITENSCFITSDEIETGKTKWQQNLGKGILLRQTEKIKTQNNIDYNKLESIDKLIENKTPISYKVLLPYLDKENENADKNFEAILNHYASFGRYGKYLAPIIKVGIRSFKKIFMPNSVLKGYWTKDKRQDFHLEKPQDNFDYLLEKLEYNGFRTESQNFGIFKYKDEDGNFYTHSLVLEHLNDFCYKKRLVGDYKDDDEYTKVIHKIEVKPEYENDFKNIKIKPNVVGRESLIDWLKKDFIDYLDCNKCQKDILNEKYHQCLKLIPIEQLLKTKIYDNTPTEYFCDFDMLNNLDSKCENIDQMVKQIMKEAMIKNDAVNTDDKYRLSYGTYLKEKDCCIEKDGKYYHIFGGNDLFEIISKKLKDETIKIRQDNHEVIKAIFKTFKYEFTSWGIDDNKKNHFTACCNLVKDLCSKYKDSIEFITCELFGTMLDHLAWFGYYAGDYAEILFQLDDSSNNKNYKFTTDQQIGFLKLLIDKLNDKNKEDENNTGYQLRKVFEIMIQQNTSVKLDQKVIDFLFLNINDAECLNNLLSKIRFQKYNFSLSLNVVERMFDLFIKAKYEDYLQNLVSCIILNDKINFISDDKKQDDEIKDAKEEQRQIRLNFIKMYLEKINGNKNLISNCTLNAFFKYFDNSLDIKKEIANYIKEYSLKIKKADMWSIFFETNQNDAVEIKKILLKGCLRFGKINYRPKNIWYKPKSYRRSNSLNEKDYFKNYNNVIEVYSDYEFLDDIKVYPIIKDDSGEGYRKLSLFNLHKDENNIEKKIVPPANSIQKESFFNWIIYCAIALIIFIAVLFFVFKEPLILFALLAPIIIFVYRFIERCKKNNPEQEKPNLKTNEKNKQASLIDKTKKINLFQPNQNDNDKVEEEITSNRVIGS